MGNFKKKKDKLHSYSSQNSTIQNPIFVIRIGQDCINPKDGARQSWIICMWIFASFQVSNPDFEHYSSSITSHWWPRGMIYKVLLKLFHAFPSSGPEVHNLKGSKERNTYRQTNKHEHVNSWQYITTFRVYLIPAIKIYADIGIKCNTCLFVTVMFI